MTVQLNGVTLNVKSIGGGYEVVKTEWDGWENGAYVRKTKVYGIVRTLELSCVEDNVAWASSAMPGFIILAKAGTEVAFSSDHPAYVESGVNVKILSVFFNVNSDGAPTVRRFTVKIRTSILA